MNIPRSKHTDSIPPVLRRERDGFTLIEVLIASVLATLTVGAVIYGFIQSAQRAEWSGYHLAAQQLAVQRMEQTRAAKWDPLAFPAVDELVAANFPLNVHVLDVPIVNGSTIFATNRVTITQTSVQPPIRLISVEVTWRFGMGNHGEQVFTNTVATFRAADQ
jgi:Tfp pilus assembly protein PilV